jgi:hypothetical protein
MGLERYYFRYLSYYLIYKHCRFRCTTRPAPVIDSDLAMQVISVLQAQNDLQMVVLLGGEPGLFPTLTHWLAKAIRALNINARVESNAFWATDDTAARQFLAPLYADGVSLMFSLDAFHAPFVPFERVERAIRVSEQLGGAYNLEIAYLNLAERKNPQDKQTEALFTELTARLGFEPKSYQGNVLFNGRSTERLADLVAEGRGVPNERCRAVPWWYNGDLDTLELLILDPDGYLSKGCGIAIGNVKQTSVTEILQSYDAHSHPILSTLLNVGPLGLAQEAGELGYVLKQDYADRCHLCQEARQVLRVKYPEYLQPDQHYTSDRKVQTAPTR